ncbi:MAG: rhomboid family intramembrane serine protease [Actinomycetota bacterium]
MTIGLIALNVFVFFQTPGFGTDIQGATYFVENAPIPCQLEDSCPSEVFGIEIPERNLLSFLASIVYSTFLHAGPIHLLGNLLFLWIFGNNVEDHFGRVRYLLFYLAGGLAATFAHIFTHMGDPIPSVGASGAVAAVMGAYILLYPHARVNVLVPIVFIFTVVQMSALTVLGLWLLYQFLIGAQEANQGVTEVAWMAHVGGFVFGVVVTFILGGRPHRPRPVWAPEWRY